MATGNNQFTVANWHSNLYSSNQSNISELEIHIILKVLLEASAKIFHSCMHEGERESY